MNDLAKMQPQRAEWPRAEKPAGFPEPEALGFGGHLGEWTVRATHTAAAGWSPLAAERLEDQRVPSASAGVQYGFSAFEGLKAYRGPDGRAHLFRPQAHARRLARSAERLRLPVVPDATFVAACVHACRMHEALLPPHGRGSLYLRPTIVADEEALGFRVAERHAFCVIVTPSSDPPPKTIRLYAERELTRAAPGGMGSAKTGGNYAAGVLGMMEARARGCDDVAWLDAATHENLGEAGTMNLFVVVDGVLRTPPLDGTILAGVTRDVVIRLARKLGLRVEEAELPLALLARLADEGRVGAAFGTGTAARLVRIGEIVDRDRTIAFPDPEDLVPRLRERLKAVQERPDPAHSSWYVTA